MHTGLYMFVFVTIVAATLYLAVGSPEPGASSAGQSHALNSMAATPRSRDSDKVGSVTSLLSGLESHLVENPGDAKGWLLLAKSYHHLGRNEDAIAAYEKAAALGMTDATFAGRITLDHL